MTILSAKGLVSSKGEGQAVSSSASVTFLDHPPVESPLVGDTAEPEFNLSTTASFHADDTSCLLLLTTPLSVSIFEGTEKSLLGTAVLSLEPLMHSAGMPEQWVPLTKDGVAAGEVLVVVMAAMSLMSEEDWEESVLFTLSLESLCNLPTRWTDAADHPFAYKAVCTVFGEEFTFAGGKLVRPTPPAEGGPGEAAEGGPGEAAEPESAAEATAACISWADAKVVRFFGPEATNALRKQLQAGEPPLSVSLSRAVNNAETHFDSNGGKYKATCAPLLGGLLVVDTTSCFDRTPVVPPTPPFEMAPPPDPPAKGKTGPEVFPVEEEEEHPYTTCGTYLKFAVSTSQPLDPKPLPPPPPLPKVGELIPKRVLPQFAPKTAAEEFDTQVANIVESMVGEWSALFPDVDASSATDEASKDDRRRALLYALNTSGKYWMFKEKLKRSVVRLVKDTMSRPTNEPLDSRASDLFYNDLYVQLTQRLHKALNGVFFPSTEAAPAPSLPDQPEGAATAAVLGALADEMEMVFSYDAAATYHKERIASCKHLAVAWYDYALFLMRVNDAPMAEECSREAIALSPATPDYLLAHGAILASRGNLEEAEVFLKSALDATPNAVDAWLVVALLYHLMERGRDKRTALKAAKALCDEDLTGAYLALARKLLPINCAVLIELALQHEEQLSGGVTGALLLTRGEMQLHSASAAVAASTLEAGLDVARKNASGYALLGKARLQLGEVEAARAAFEKALERSPQPYPLATLLLLGRLCLDAGESARAKELFLYACRQRPSCTSWLGAGQACHALGELEQAEESLSEANVLNNRHPLVWGQLALLCLEKGRLEEAEQALHEAYKLGLVAAPLLQQLGGALIKTGQWQRAEGALLRSLGTAESPLARKLLGDALVEQQRHEEALAAYMAASAQGMDCKSQAALCKSRLNR